MRTMPGRGNAMRIPLSYFLIGFSEPPKGYDERFSISLIRVRCRVAKWKRKASKKDEKKNETITDVDCSGGVADVWFRGVD